MSQNSSNAKSHPAFQEKGPDQNPKSEEWVDLDPSLITEDICMQCARCCKVTLRQPYNKDKMQYLKAMFEHTPRVEVKRESTKNIGVVNWCSQLQTDLTCGIYKNRPKICQEYNCFDMGNKTKKLPEYYDFVKELLDAKGIKI